MNSAGGHKIPPFYDAFGRRLAGDLFDFAPTE